MTLETWLLFIAVSIAPVMSPGPGILFSITTSLRYGVKTTIIIGMTNALGIALLGIAVGLGLGVLMKASLIAFIALKVVGAMYLIWLGIKIWRDRSAFLIDPKASSKPAPMTKLIIQSLSISLTNPKAIIAIAALFPPFLNPALPAINQVLILSISYATLCALNHVLIAYSGNWLRRFLSSPRRANNVRRLIGGAFMGFGSLLALSARS